MPRILVVDDSNFVRERVVKLLEIEGYEVISAKNGRMAVDSYIDETPDAVLMDITMPELDGLGALTEIRAFDQQANVIMLTALDQQMMVTRAMHLGARDYLTKPTSAQQLIKTLNQVLVRSRAIA